MTSANLAGRSIAFVDDQFDVNRYFISELRDAGATLHQSRGLKEAVDLSDSTAVDMWIIDLHLPIPDPIPVALEKYRAEFVRESGDHLNAGQLMGMYLNGRTPAQLFVYLSAVPSYYVPFASSVSPVRPSVLSKFHVDPAELVRILSDRLQNGAGAP